MILEVCGSCNLRARFFGMPEDIQKQEDFPHRG